MEIKKLFGTDGIRAAADEFPLDRNTVGLIGNSLAHILEKRLGRPADIVTGRDTRESGASIEAAIHSGVLAAGASITSAGVITTPGVAFAASRFGYDAGVVISASHNPFQDNGIKIFLPSGQKLDRDAEAEIEKAVANGGVLDPSPQTPDVSREKEILDAYIEYLLDDAESNVGSGLKLVIDCANGATSDIAPELFRRLGAEVVAIHHSPDGRNINENCGSLHLDDLAAKVISEKATMGIAFDGDADRSLFVDAEGSIVDGDAVLLILARYLRSRGGLKNEIVVATVMSNIGLELALKDENITLKRTDVGDKYVLEELIGSGSELGGEQSGHIICPEKSLVGDGMRTAILLLDAIRQYGGDLALAAKSFTRYPQILVNVKVREKVPFESVPEIVSASKELSQKLKGSGRLLLRYSGTENLARVMIEGRDQAIIAEQANSLAETIKQAIGA